MEQKDLINYVCESVLKPLNEERGRIPFIEDTLDELETQITQQIDSNIKHGYYLDKYCFKPKEETFFNKLCFLKGSKIVINNDIQYPEVYGYAALPQMTYNEKENKIDILPIFIEITTNQKNFSFAFRSLLSHEILHGYECFKRKLNKVNFKPDNGFYGRVISLVNNEADIFQRCIGHFLYYAVPQEKRAYSQQIQTIYKDEQFRFGKYYKRYPFEQIKSNIPFFQELYETFDKLEELMRENPQKCILIFNYAFGLNDNNIPSKNKKQWNGKPIKTEYACRKLINNIKFDLEQTYNKALCRAIEDEWLHRQDLAF